MSSKSENLDWLQLVDDEKPEESLSQVSHVIGTNTGIDIDKISDVDSITVGDVYDTHGRLGDSCHSAGKTYDIACIPFELLNLPNYTKSIQGYTIQAICNKYFAMDTQPRPNKIEEYTQDILQCIQSGVDFSKNLTRFVDGHKTYDLTFAECSIIFSRFRNNVQHLGTDANGDMIMRVGVNLC